MAPAWPWPLDAVENWFNGLWTWVGEASNNAVSVVAGWINDAAGWVRDRVFDAAGWVRDRIQDLLAGLGNALNAVQTFLAERIAGIPPAISSVVSGLINWLADSIHGGLEWLNGSISSAATTISESMSGFFNWLADGIHGGLEWLHDGITSGISGLLDWLKARLGALDEKLTDVGTWIVNSVGESTSAAIDVIGTGISRAFEGVTGAFSGVFGTLGSLYDIVNPTEVADAFLVTLKGFGFSPDPLKIPGFGADADEYLKQVDEWAFGINTQFHAVATVGAILEAATLGQYDVAYQQYLNEPRVAAFTAAAKEVWTMEFQAKLGIRANQAFLAKYTPLIPPVQDLIRFVVREVIPPAEFYATMPFLGFSPKIARDYWEAHWILPDPSRLIDAFHRGKLKKEELDKYIVWHDFKPENRPGISKSDLDIYAGTLKTLIPRVDLRYAWEMDQLTREDLIERYEWLGYEDDAPLMADIQINRALVEEINKVRNESLNDFIAGLITEETLRGNLAALGISSLRIDYYIQYALKRRERNRKNDLLDLYRDGFLKDLLEEEQFRARVAEIIVIPEVADLFVDKAYSDKYKKAAPPRATTEDDAAAELQKYQISYAVEAYRKYAIEKNELVQLLTAAGVDPAVAEERAKYEELKRPLPKPDVAAVALAKDQVNVQKAVRDAAVLEYRQYAIDESELLRRLQDAGLSDALAMATVQLETLRRPERPPSPEEVESQRLAAEVKRLRGLALEAYYRAYALTKEELIAEMITAGFDPAEAAARADLQDAKRPAPKPSAKEIEATREAKRVQSIGEQEALTLFRAGEISGEEFSQRLRDLGYGVDLIAALREYEEVKLALKGGVAAG